MLEVSRKAADFFIVVLAEVHATKAYDFAQSLRTTRTKDSCDAG